MEKLTFEQLPQAVALLLEKVSRIEQLLAVEPVTDAPYGQMLTAVQAAQYLDISMSLLYKLTSRRELPVYKPGGKKLYLKRQELDAYLSRSRNSSQEEIEQEALAYVLKNPLKVR